MDEPDEKLMENVRRYGWQATHILGEGDAPPYSFSIGLYRTFRHPEILVMGLADEVAQAVINNMGSDIKDGSRFEANGFYSGILENHDCTFRDVPIQAYADYVGWAIWYYQGDDFPLVQCIWPSKEGFYPWQPEFPDEFQRLQPVLGPASPLH
jgi:hypothetical protein